jgi:hypothetical protein
VSAPVERDPWAVLGLADTATLDEVRAARRRLAKERHPDHGGDLGAMRELNEAFDRVVRSLLHAAAGTTAPPSPPAGAACTPPSGRDARFGPGRSRRSPYPVEHDTPSFTIDVLPVDAFEALLVVAGWIGEVLVDDPPYLLDVHLHDPSPCWCRLELLPEAGGTTVNLTVASVGRDLAPPAEAVRDVWVDQLNRLS